MGGGWGWCHTCGAYAFGVEADDEQGGGGVVLGRLLSLLLPPLYSSVPSREFYLEVFQLQVAKTSDRDRDREGHRDRDRDRERGR